MSNDILSEVVTTLSRLSALYPTGVPKVKNLRAIFIVKKDEFRKPEEQLLKDAVTKGLGWSFEQVLVFDENEVAKSKEYDLPTVYLGVLGDGISTVSLVEALASPDKKRIFWNDIKKLL